MNSPIQKSRWLKVGVLCAIAMILLTVAAGMTLWWWAGTEGSLASALRWIPTSQNLNVEKVRGALRSGGKIGRLAWQQQGLIVEARDIEITWQPLSLLHGTLHLPLLHIADIKVDDQRAPTASSGPPDDLGLPMRVVLDEISVARFGFTGPVNFTASDIAARYAYDGTKHQLHLGNVQIASGRYRGEAGFSAHQKLILDASLSGTVSSAMLTSRTAKTVPLDLHATLRGPLTDLLLDAALEITSNVSPGPADNKAAQANASARITPWAAQPLASADVRFQNLDVAALWPEAPPTMLTGEMTVRPDSNAANNRAGWLLQTKINNQLAGPWDQQRLPLQSLDAEGEWRNGTALIRSLDAKLGNGELKGSGKWMKDNAAWKLQFSAQNINPALLHTQMAALPLNGRADVQSDNSVVSFDASIKAKNQLEAVAAKNAITNTANPLRLRDAAVTGNWKNKTLTLSSLRVRSDDAELNGRLEVQPETKSGSGNLQLIAPGLKAKLQGSLRETSGNGNANVLMRNAAQATRWIQKLPGIPHALLAGAADGSAMFNIDWQGGWRDPFLKARLQSDALQWQMLENTSTLKFNAMDATLSGRLRQMQLKVQGRMEDGAQRYALEMAAEGGRIKPADWQGRIQQLNVGVNTINDVSATGQWQIKTQDDVALKWIAKNFTMGMGEATVSAPAEQMKNTAPAKMAWHEIRWDRGELSSAGKFSGLPLAWVSQWAGLQKAPQAGTPGLSGNLLLDGEWDVSLGNTLDITASINRSSGDLSLQPERGTSSRITAGVKMARLALRSNNDNVMIDWHWESERAGKVDGELKTRLTRSPIAKNKNNSSEVNLFGWRWPDTAPLNGHLQASLPRIGIWSVMAPPGWRLQGSLSADITIGGTYAQPQLTGNLSADDLALRSVADGIELGNGRLRATLDGTRIHISEFSLQGAGGAGNGGTISAQGDAGWMDGRPQAQLNAKLEHLRASIRSDRQLTLSGDVQATLDSTAAGEQAAISGKLLIDQARIVLPDESTPQLSADVVVRDSHASAAPPVRTKATKNAGSAADNKNAKPARPVKLDVQLDLGRDFRVSGKGIDTRMRGTLAIAGDARGNPQLTGTVQTFGGEYRAYGQWLDIEQGVLRFSGPIDNPALDILAIRPNLTQRVGVQITGTALLPRVRLYTDPDLPDAEKLSWLVVGHSSASGGAESALLQQAALALLGSKGGGMSGGLAASLGLDELSYAGATTNADGTTSGNAVTLGKRFSRNFYVAYERSVSGALGTLYLFYDLSKRFTVRTQTGQQSAVDLIFTIPYD